MTNPAHFLDWFSSTAWYYKPPSAHLRLLFFLSFFTSSRGHPNITIIKNHIKTSGMCLASASHPLFEVYTLPLWVYVPPSDISTWPPRQSTNNLSTTLAVCTQHRLGPPTSKEEDLYSTPSNRPANFVASCQGQGVVFNCRTLGVPGLLR